MLLALSAKATSGKDTFASILATVVRPRKFVSVAFAEELKRELDPFFRAFGGTAYETDPAKKALIRPILVSHGMTQRELTDGRYWIDKVTPTVKRALKEGSVVAVTDCRFPNEADWIHENGGKVIYLDRPDVKPANVEEAHNDPLVRAKADIVVSWPTLKTPEGHIDVDKLTKIVQDTWSQIK